MRDGRQHVIRQRTLQCLRAEQASNSSSWSLRGRQRNASVRRWVACARLLRRRLVRAQSKTTRVVSDDSSPYAKAAASQAAQYRRRQLVSDAAQAHCG